MSLSTSIYIENFSCVYTHTYAYVYACLVSLSLIPGAVFTKGLTQVLGLIWLYFHTKVKPKTWLRPFMNTGPGKEKNAVCYSATQVVAYPTSSLVFSWSASKLYNKLSFYKYTLVCIHSISVSILLVILNF